MPMAPGVEGSLRSGADVIELPHGLAADIGGVAGSQQMLSGSFSSICFIGICPAEDPGLEIPGVDGSVGTVGRFLLG